MSLEIALIRIQEAKKRNNNTLDLSNLGLKEIPKEIGALKGISIINLSNNHISTIKEVEVLSNFFVIDLSNNHIFEISKQLVEVNLPILWSLPENNNNSYGIYVKNNPLINPPLEIIKQGQRKIRSFFAEKQLQFKALNEVKVILVGDGGSGKTDVVRQLSDEFPIQKKIEGIHISKQHFRIKNENLTVHFWDFSGREILYTTHQFFLTKRCIYILVLDAQKEEKTEYWLKYIQRFGGNAKVLIVFNKIDANPYFDVDRAYLKKCYPNIIAFKSLSCKTGVGIDDIKNLLLDNLWHLELRNIPFPSSWLQVKDHFATINKAYLSYKDYITICRENGINDEESPKVLLHYLNELGILLNFGKEPVDATFILQPQWLTNAVYRVINSPKIAKNTGRFYKNDLEQIINDEYYFETYPNAPCINIPEHQFNFLIEIMQQFELIYKIGTTQYIVPELLPIQELTVDLSTTSEHIQLVLAYTHFLPSSILPRLMVKLQEYIYKDKVWKRGMVLQEKNVNYPIAKIILNRAKNKIHITVAGDNKERNKDFMTQIRDTIKDINKEFYQLIMSEWIPLPDQYNGETVYVEYEELIGYLKCDRQVYFNGKVKKRYNVMDLLGAIEPGYIIYSKLSPSIYISFAHEDIVYKEKLETVIHFLKKRGYKLLNKIEAQTGENKQKRINYFIERANIVIVLCSFNYLEGKNEELSYIDAVVKPTSKSQALIPIIIKECMWEESILDGRLVLPRAGKRLQGLNDDSTWTEIAKEIKSIVLNL